MIEYNSMTIEQKYRYMELKWKYIWRRYGMIFAKSMPFNIDLIKDASSQLMKIGNKND